MSGQFGNQSTYTSDLNSPEAKRDKKDNLQVVNKTNWADELIETDTDMTNKRGRDARRDSTELMGMGQDLKSVLEVVEGLKKTLDELKADINDLKKLDTKVVVVEQEVRGIRYDLNQVLIDSVKKWVVIKGLKKHQNALRYESRAQTSEVLDGLTRFLEVRVTFSDFMRLPDFNQGRINKVGVVRAEFLTMTDKLIFFNSLAAKSGSEQLKGVSVDQELPRFLLPQKKLLETEAYNLRRTKKVKTRVIIRKGRLVLQTKAKEDGSIWVTIDTNAGEAES